MTFQVYNSYSKGGIEFLPFIASFAVKRDALEYCAWKVEGMDGAMLIRERETSAVTIVERKDCQPPEPPVAIPHFLKRKS